MKNEDLTAYIYFTDYATAIKTGVIMRQSQYTNMRRLGQIILRRFGGSITYLTI